MAAWQGSGLRSSGDNLDSLDSQDRTSRGKRRRSRPDQPEQGAGAAYGAQPYMDYGDSAPNTGSSFDDSGGSLLPPQPSSGRPRSILKRPSGSEPPQEDRPLPPPPEEALKSGGKKKKKAKKGKSKTPGVDQADGESSARSSFLGSLRDSFRGARPKKGPIAESSPPGTYSEPGSNEADDVNPSPNKQKQKKKKSKLFKLGRRHPDESSSSESELVAMPTAELNKEHSYFEAIMLSGDSTGATDTGQEDQTTPRPPTRTSLDEPVYRRDGDDMYPPYVGGAPPGGPEDDPRRLHMVKPPLPSRNVPGGGPPLPDREQGQREAQGYPQGGQPRPAPQQGGGPLYARPQQPDRQYAQPPQPYQMAPSAQQQQLPNYQAPQAQRANPPIPQRLYDDETGADFDSFAEDPSFVEEKPPPLPPPEEEAAPPPRPKTHTEPRRPRPSGKTSVKRILNQSAEDALALDSTFASIKPEYKAFMAKRQNACGTWTAFWFLSAANLFCILAFVSPGWGWTLEVNGEGLKSGEYYGWYGVWYACWTSRDGTGHTVCESIRKLTNSPVYQPPLEALATLTLVLGLIAFVILVSYILVPSLNYRFKVIIAFTGIVMGAGLANAAMLVYFCTSFYYSSFHCCDPTIQQRQIVEYALFYDFYFSTAAASFYFIATFLSTYEIIRLRKLQILQDYHAMMGGSVDNLLDIDPKMQLLYNRIETQMSYRK